MTKLWAIGLMIVCAIVTSTGQLFYKLGAAQLPTVILTNWQIWTGLFCYGFAMLLFMLAMKGGEVSVLYPILATAFIWANIFSMIFLGENINTMKWIGSAGIVLGISLLGIGSRPVKR